MYDVVIMLYAILVFISYIFPQIQVSHTMATFFTRGRSLGAACTLAVGAAAAYLAQEQKVLARNWHSRGHLMYPASSNFPDIRSHNNTMAKFLTPEVNAAVLKL